MMAGLDQGYPEYQPSEIGWLVGVPIDWLLYRMDDFTDTVRNQIDPNALGSMTVTHYSIPSVQEFGMGLIEEGETIDSNKFIVTEGDVLFSKLNPRKETITIVRNHAEKIVSSTEFVVLRPKEKADARFLKYLLHSQELKSFVCSQVESATKSHQRVNPSVVSKLKFYAPSQNLRTVIANFLDHETAKIDTLIDKQQQLIKLLKEKRQAVISHAVTKGLNPAAPMKDSGVEWLGEVPEHWEVAMLKYFWTVLDCKHITAEFVDDGIPLASIKEVKSWIVDLSDAKKTTEKYYELLIEGNRKPQFGDVIYSRNATVGEAALVPEDVKFAMGQDVCLLKKQTKFNSEYFLHQLNSPTVKLQLESLLIGSTFKRINVEEIRNYWVVNPPIEEQDEIAAFLQSKSNRYDQLIKKAETAIILMQERRTALISAAVTGKIDVRNWEPAG